MSLLELHHISPLMLTHGVHSTAPLSTQLKVLRENFELQQQTRKSGLSNELIMVERKTNIRILLSVVT